MAMATAGLGVWSTCVCDAIRARNVGKVRPSPREQSRDLRGSRKSKDTKGKEKKSALSYGHVTRGKATEKGEGREYGQQQRITSS